ncbi:hypothetical protein [Streptomyces sp. NPDC000878]
MALRTGYRQHLLAEAERHLRLIGAARGIRNLYFGDIPTTWVDPLQPYDGYLSEFLMATRGYRES